MEINKEIEEKAKDIIIQKHKELEQGREVKDYIQLCIEARICPICGGDIVCEYKQDGRIVRITYKCSCNWRKSTTM